MDILDRSILGLLDCEPGFLIFSYNEDNDIYMPYGAFAATIANINYCKMVKDVTWLMHKYSRKISNPDYRPKFKEYFYTIISFHINCTFCLDNKQTHVVAKYLSEEMFDRFVDEIEEGHDVITGVEKFIPFILYPEIRNNVKNILKRKSDDLTIIMQETGTSDIHLQLVKAEVFFYYVFRPSDYLLIDLKRYLKHSGITLKECECCGHLFVPTRKSDKYCNAFNINKFPDKERCKDTMRKSPNDKFVKARNKARDKQHKQIRYYENKGEYNHNFLHNMYDMWSYECGYKFEQCKAKEDLNEFKNWIEKTKFSKEMIQSIYDKYICIMKYMKMNNII